jgi:hypothetical protein
VKGPDIVSQCLSASNVERRTSNVFSRIICLIALVASLGAADPLVVQGEDAAAVHHALQALTRGDTGPLAALPARIFTAPVGIADPREPSVLHRWTVMLPQAMARVASEQRERVLQGLDVLYGTVAPDGDLSSLAADFLPVPRAAARVRQKADTAFDRGHFPEFLATTRRLAQAGLAGPSFHEREMVVLRLLGIGAVADDSIALQAPAMGLSRDTLIDDRPTAAGLTLRWQVIPGWLLACSDDDRVLWQLRTGPGAAIVTGPGGALVRDTDGARLVDEDGGVFALPPLPRNATMLGISGGAAWFGAERIIWRMDLRSHAVASLNLDAVPIGSPVARGSRSLWLAADRLLLVEGDRLIAHWTHRYQVGPGWRLIDGWPTSGLIGIRAPDGRAYPIKNLTEVLANETSGPADRAWFLAHAGRRDEALAELAKADGTKVESIIAAHLALGPDHVRATWQTLIPLAEKIDNRQFLATILTLGLPDTAAAHHLRTVATAHPDLELPPAHLVGVRCLERPDTWAQALRGRTWLDGTAGVMADLVRREVGTWRQVAAPSDNAAAIDDAMTVRSDGTVVYRNRILQAERPAYGPLSITCREAGGACRWRQAWAPLPGVQALSQVISASNEVVFIMEGDARLSALDFASGDLLARIAIPDGASNPSQMVIPRRDTIALLGPAGVDRQAWVISNNDMQTVLLPAPAKWLLPLGSRTIAVLADGRALTVPELNALDLPKELAQPPRPVITRQGILHGTRLYPWVSP